MRPIGTAMGISAKWPGQNWDRCAPAHCRRLVTITRAILLAVATLSPLVQAETLTASLPMDGPGQSIAVNPATNKIYLANAPKGVLVVDGATNVTTKVGGSTSPTALALNPLSNKIYAVNSSSNNVTVIDGGNNSAVTVAVGTNPIAVAVNPVTNKIYVADNADVTVIDGTNNSKTNISSILLPSCIAVNPVTNKIYVPGNTGPGYGVTVINGADNTTSFVATGLNPDAIAVNPVTNKIYVANQASGTVTVINGADNTTATVSAGTNPIAVGLNPVTNKIYVANKGDGTHASTVTVIDGGNNTTTTVNAGISPEAVAVDPVTNRIYVTNLNDSNLTVIDGTTNTAKNLSIGSTGNTVEFAVATNPITGKIYVGTGAISGSITPSVVVIDGATNTTATLAVVAPQHAVAVNPASNRIYAVSPTANAVTVINGVTDMVVDTVITGTNPQALAINPVTNKIYVANHDSNSLTVINGANDVTTTVAVNASPSALAVDPVANRIYVVYDNNSIMDVFDGATDTPMASAILPSGSVAVALNPVSNKVYVLSASGNSVTVIDGASTTTTTIAAGTTPLAIAVNPVTNKIYVANYASNNITVINGADNTTTTVAVGSGPIAIAVNPVNNRIYVSDILSNDVAVIDGLTNAVTPVTVGTHPADVQVDPVTNKIYLANRGSNNVTFIDGPTNVANNISTASTPFAFGINPATGKIYATMSSSNILSVITEQKVQPSLLATTIAPLPGNQFIFPGSPTFNFAIDTAALPVQGVYFQLDTWQGPWAKAGGSGSNFSGTAPPLLPGIHVVYAYAVDGQFADSIQPGNSNGGQSSPIPGAIVAYVFVVLPAPTTTTLSLTGGQNPAVYGQILTFSATVSGGAGTPTGVASYTLFGAFGGAFLLGTQTLDGNGQAQLSDTTLTPPGDYQITASYEGNSVYGSSTSSRLNLTVNRAASSTAVTGTTSAIYGQPVTLIASVLPQFTGTPIGKVHFYDGATLLGTATLSSGSATLITSTLSGGARSITAVYDGDTNFMGSDSNASPLTVTVSRATSTAGISLLLGSNPSTYGVPLFFQAVVTPQFSGTPGGQVTFKDGNTVIGTHALINGQAVITVATLAIGVHSLTAIYSGDGNFTGSTSSALGQTVNAGSGTPITVTLSFFPTVQPNTRLFGRAVAYIATVSPSTATGSVYFIDGNTLVGSGALSNSGIAVFIANQFTVGRHSITAAYGGDGTYSSNVSVPGVFYRSPRPH